MTKQLSGSQSVETLTREVYEAEHIRSSIDDASNPKASIEQWERYQSLMSSIREKTKELTASELQDLNTRIEALTTFESQLAALYHDVGSYDAIKDPLTSLEQSGLDIDNDPETTETLLDEKEKATFGRSYDTAFELIASPDLHDQTLDELSNNNEELGDNVLSFASLMMTGAGFDDVCRDMIDKAYEQKEVNLRELAQNILTQTDSWDTIASYMESHNLNPTDGEKQAMTFLQGDSVLARDVRDRIWNPIIEQLDVNYLQDEIERYQEIQHSGFFSGLGDTKVGQEVSGAVEALKDLRIKDAFTKHPVGLGTLAVGGVASAILLPKVFRGAGNMLDRIGGWFSSNKKEKKSDKQETKSSGGLLKWLGLGAAGGLASLWFFGGKNKGMLEKLEDGWDTLMEWLGWDDDSEEQNQVEEGSAYQEDEERQASYEDVDHEEKTQFEALSEQTICYHEQLGNTHDLKDFDPTIIYGINGSFDTVDKLLSKHGFFEQGYQTDVMTYINHISDFDNRSTLLTPYLESIPGWKFLFGSEGPTTDQNFMERLQKFITDSDDAKDHLERFFYQSMFLREYLLTRLESLEYQIAKEIIQEKGFRGEQFPTDTKQQDAMIQAALLDDTFYNRVSQQATDEFGKLPLVNADNKDAFEVLKKRGLLEVDDIQKPDSILTIEEEQQDNIERVDELIEAKQRDEKLDTTRVQESAHSMVKKLDSDIKEGMLESLLSPYYPLADLLFESEGYDRKEFVGVMEHIQGDIDGMKAAFEPFLDPNKTDYSIKELETLKSHIDDFSNLQKRIQYGTLYTSKIDYDSDQQRIIYTIKAIGTSFGKQLWNGITLEYQGVTSGDRQKILQGYTITMPGAIGLYALGIGGKLTKAYTRPARKVTQLGLNLSQKTLGLLGRAIGMSTEGLRRRMFSSPRRLARYYRSLPDVNAQLARMRYDLYKGLPPQRLLRTVQKMGWVHEVDGITQSYDSIDDLFAKLFGPRAGDINLSNYRQHHSVRKVLFDKQGGGISRLFQQRNITLSPHAVEQLQIIDQLSSQGTAYDDLVKGLLGSTKRLDHAVDVVQTLSRSGSLYNIMQIDGIDPTHFGKELGNLKQFDAAQVKKALAYIIKHKESITNPKAFVRNVFAYIDHVDDIAVDKLNKTGLFGRLPRLKTLTSSTGKINLLPQNLSIKTNMVPKIQESFGKVLEKLNIAKSQSTNPEAVAATAKAIDHVTNGRADQILPRIKQLLSSTSSHLHHAGRFCLQLLGGLGALYGGYESISTFIEATNTEEINQAKAQMLRQQGTSEALLAAGSAAILFIPGVNIVAAIVGGAVIAGGYALKETYYGTINRYLTNYYELKQKAKYEIYHHLIAVASGRSGVDLSRQERMSELLTVKDMDFLGHNSINASIKALLFVDALEDNEAQGGLAMLYRLPEKKLDLIFKDLHEQNPQQFPDYQSFYSNLGKQYGAVKDQVNERFVQLKEKFGTQAVTEDASISVNIPINAIGGSLPIHLSLGEDTGETIDVINILENQDFLQSLEHGSGVQWLQNAIAETDPYDSMKQCIPANIAQATIADATFIDNYVPKTEDRMASHKEKLSNSNYPLLNILYRIAREVHHIDVPNDIESLRTVFHEGAAGTLGIYFASDTVIKINNDNEIDEGFGIDSGPTYVQKFKEEMTKAMNQEDLIYVQGDSGEKVLNQEYGKRYLDIIGQEIERMDMTVADFLQNMRQEIYDHNGDLIQLPLEMIQDGINVGFDGVGEVLYRWDSEKQDVMVYRDGEEKPLRSILAAMNIDYD